MTDYILGIDVSKWQASVAWSTAKQAGVEYVYIKGMEWYFEDAKFKQHWSGSKAAGLLRGSYLYYRDVLLPEPQAQKFYDLLLATGDLGELPPALDLEEYGNLQLTASKIKTCLETLEALFQRKPVVYSRKNILDKWLGAAPWLKQYPLWQAQYTLAGWHVDHFEKVKQYPPEMPLAYTERHIWQFSDKCPAQILGVSGNTVDVNYAEPDKLAALTNNPPPDPEPEPPPTGDLLMQFKAKLTYNIRSGPGTNYPDIGDLLKDTIITALEIQTVSASSVWVRFEPGKWVALVHAGAEYLDFHAAAPCPEGDPMPTIFTPTHKVTTTAPNGEKLRAWPGGSEAVQVYHGDLLMKLKQSRGNPKEELMAFEKEGVIITGWINPVNLIEL